MRFSTDPGLKRQVYWFTVTGRGRFPWDMLRFDMAWPATGEDGDRMLPFEGGHDSLRRRSVRMGCVQRGGPTIERWSSFGWSVGDLNREEVG